MKESWLRGKTALVTGAGKRLGHEIAVALADEGANVVIHYRTSVEEAEELRRELAERGVKSWAVKADFDELSECEELVSRAHEVAGPLHVLVNSASIFPPSTMGDVEFQQIVECMQINAWAPFVVSRDFARQTGWRGAGEAPTSREQGGNRIRGKIVNLLDARVMRGYDFTHVAYFVSKHALLLLTRLTAIEFAPHVTVNGVAPGLILPPPGQDESYLERLVGTVPLKRHGDPGDIAEAVTYLLKSNYVTGQVINVDGGRHLMEYGNGPHPDQ